MQQTRLEFAGSPLKSLLQRLVMLFYADHL